MYEIVLTGPSNPWAHRPERSRGNFSPPAYWWEAVDNNWFVILFNVCLSGMNVSRVATLDTRHSLATTTVFWIRTGKSSLQASTLEAHPWIHAWLY